MTQTPPTITRMLECLRLQKEGYAQLLEMALRQKIALEDENEKDLAKAMQDKNPLLQTLQELDEEMKPVLKNMSETDRALMIQKGGALKDDASKVLKQLIAVEDDCARILNVKKEETFEQMKVFQEAKKGVKGYKETGGGKPPRFSQEG